MPLVNARAAFEKAVTDAVTSADATVKMVYDNTPFTTPGKTVKYVKMSVNFGQSTIQNQGASAYYYAGSVRCEVFVPRKNGTNVLAAISESVIDGLTSVNAANYTDAFSCKPRTEEVVGPIPIDPDSKSHFLGIISCSFSANA